VRPRCPLCAKVPGARQAAVGLPQDLANLAMVITPHTPPR
jgi:hypothetical protein